MTNNPTDVASRTNGAAPDSKKQTSKNDHQFERMARQAGDQIKEMASDVSSATADSIKTSRDYVKGHPVKSVAFAAMAGVIAGSVLTMVLRPRRG
jgi:ElaB/YqjD/DUF883 family membrane-anchored ribosome-binding protein